MTAFGGMLCRSCRRFATRVERDDSAVPYVERSADLPQTRLTT